MYLSSVAQRSSSHSLREKVARQVTWTVANSSRLCVWRKEVGDGEALSNVGSNRGMEWEMYRVQCG